MATSSIYTASETVGLYGIGSPGGTYFEWFIFYDSATAPATPTGGSWSFSTNTGTTPTGWVASPPPSPTNLVWVSIAVVDSRSTGDLTWSTPGLMTGTGLPVLTGAGVPSSGTGLNTQLYLDTSTTPQSLYNKQSGTWVQITGSTLYALAGANANITSLTGLTGGVSTADYVDFDTTYSTTLTAGRLGWDGNNTLGLGMAGGNVVQHIGEDVYYYVKASATITKGELCMFTGAVGASGVVTAAPASGVTNAQYIMGIAAEDIANNAFGLITWFGVLRNVNTAAFAEGDILYYNSAVAGGMTNTFPASGPIVLVAAVTKSGSGSGSLQVRVSVTQRMTSGTGITVTQGDTGTALAIDSTVATLTGTQTLTNKTINAANNTITNIPNASLVYDSVNINSVDFTLGNVQLVGPDWILPSYAGNAGKVLTVNPSASDVQWNSVSGTGTVTSVDVSGGTTGLTTTGGPITAAGTITIGGTLALASGGTGATTASGARGALGLGTAAELNAGVAGGVATLDGGGTVPTSQLPAAVLGALKYQGTWDANANSPTLASSVGTQGYYYVVSVAGATNLNGITDWQIGDWAIYNGTAWQKIDNTDAVTSVNGLTGTVVLTYSDITSGNINNAPIGGTTPASGAFTTLSGTTITATTKVVTPYVDAANSAGGQLRNASGTSQLAWGAGGGSNLSLEVATNINPANAAVSIAPTGTGTVTINPATAGTMNNMVIGGTTAAEATVTTLTATSDSSFTSTGAVQLSSGTTAQRPTGAAGKLRFNTTTAEFEGYNGSAWASVGGSAISNDTSTSTNLYPLFAAATSGTASSVYTSNAQYLFKPSTGELSVKAPVAANGVVVNADSVTSDYTIATGTNGFSVGPLTVASGVSLTVASGQRHVII